MPLLENDFAYFPDVLPMVASDRTTQCPQCAGTASVVPGRDYLQCDYCQSLVFSAGNPLTVDRIVSLAETMEAANCPVCACDLTMGRIDDHPVLFCEKCYGLLIRNQHFATVIRERRARQQNYKACQPLDPSQYDRHLGCPNCRQTMEVHPYYGPGNVVIDSCAECGYLWLDHGELKTVVCAEGGACPPPQTLQATGDGMLSLATTPTTAAANPHHNPAFTLYNILEAIFR